MNSGLNIWLVDDDRISLVIARHLFERHPRLNLTGVFERAGDVLQALKDDESRPDLIIIDINMPVMSGWELIELIREEHQQTPLPVAVFTSSIDNRDEQRAIKYDEVIGFFVKPLTGELLDTIVDRLQEGKENS